MKGDHNKFFLGIITTLLVGWLSWLSKVIIDQDKRMAVLEFVVLKSSKITISNTKGPSLGGTPENVHGSIGFPVPNLTGKP